MLIPFGWLASSAGGEDGAYDLISTSFGDGSSTEIVLYTSGLSATYRHLQIRIVSRMLGTSYTYDDLGVRLNGVSAVSSYYSHVLEGTGATVASSTNPATTSRIAVGRVPTASEDVGIFSTHIIDILDFGSTTKNKTVRTLAGLTSPTSSRAVGVYSGLNLTTAAITSIAISGANGTTFSSLTRFSVYGIKG